MLIAEIIGNLGYDAVVKQINGKDYVSFDVAHEERNGNDYCTVSERDMQNFMHATNPDIQGTRFIDSEKLRGKRSVPVRVVRRGPLYGVTGKFLRYGGRHYIAIEMPQSTALLKVSYTWCETIEE